jgi:hypothetical protein
MFDNVQVSKAAITRLFGISAVLVAAGAVIGTVAVITALANGAIAFGGEPFIRLDAGQIAGAIVWLVIASLLAGIGTVGAMVSWGFALLNTSRLSDKTWFTALLGLGLVSLGWVAMFVYTLKGPDSTKVSPANAAGLAAG